MMTIIIVLLGLLALLALVGKKQGILPQAAFGKVLLDMSSPNGGATLPDKEYRVGLYIDAAEAGKMRPSYLISSANLTLAYDPNELTVVTVTPNPDALDSPILNDWQTTPGKVRYVAVKTTTDAAKLPSGKFLVATVVFRAANKTASYTTQPLVLSSETKGITGVHPGEADKVLDASPADFSFFVTLDEISTPADLGASCTSPRGPITLTWKDHSPGEDGNQVERNTGNGTLAMMVDTKPNATMFVDESANDPNATYIYRVRAYQIQTGATNKYSDWSEPVNISCGAVISRPPSPPISGPITPPPGELYAVNIHPGRIDATESGEQIGMSTLATDASGTAIKEGITFEWGISSNTTIGTLERTDTDTNVFFPGKPGRGDLFVTARQRTLILPGRGEAKSVTASVPVVVLPRLEPVLRGKIVYASYVSDTNTEIFTMNADGTNVNQLTKNDGRDDSANFSWDGKRIVFASERDRTSGIYSMNADGSQLTQVVKAIQPAGPVFTPDGKRILFHASAENNSYGIIQIFIVDVDGSNLRQLTQGSAPIGASYPAVSPDGKTVVFESGSKEGNIDIYTMDIDGKNIKRLTTDEGIDWYASYSPDGSRIVYSSEQRFSQGHNLFLYMMNSDGSDKKLLPTSDLVGIFPSFSPDGKKILFLGQPEVRGPAPKGLTWQLYVFDIGTKQVVKLRQTDTGKNLNVGVAWVDDVSVPTPTPPKTCPASKPLGDANCDGFVDGYDYSIWLNSQCAPNLGDGQVCGSLDADFDGNQQVNDTDFEIWFTNRQAPGDPPIVPFTPTPPTIQ